ncbi:MAG: 2-oxoacid:acceptor oxidoreductase family protein [Pseudomonadota bacterium]
MKEIRFHGRGGQGVVMAATILVKAFIQEGKYAAGFPFFGAERRGAPVTAFVRCDQKRIREKTQVYRPDCLVVLEPRQLLEAQTFQGLKPQGILVANSARKDEFPPQENLKLAGLVDAFQIAMEELGFPAPNTCMLGAFAAATGWVGLDSILAALDENFTGVQLTKNIKSVKRGFESIYTYRYRAGTSAAGKAADRDSG